MAATAPESCSYPSDAAADSIKESLHVLEGMFAEAPERPFDSDYFDALGDELRRLHARLRTHHASGQLNAAQTAIDVPPELTEEVHRLRSEHSAMIGQLDRLIRSVDSMVDRSLEDKEVFVLRGRELIATLRRHEAEEDRLFYLAVWRDLGGES